MPKRQVFFSFHYENDCWRTQQIRNIGAIEGNSIVSPSTWEEVKRKGDDAIKTWIDTNLQNRSCTIVLIGSETAGRHWIEYEIIKSWKEKNGLFGIRIHNLKSLDGYSDHGTNPFDEIQFTDGTPLSRFIRTYDPNPSDAYNDIANNLENWIETAIKEAQNR